MTDESWTLGRRGPLRGELCIPGDKSISHRALMFNGLATGSAKVRGLLDSEDVAATAMAMRALGVVVQPQDDGVLVMGAGLSAPEGVVDCGNSGTSMRLLAGIAASQPFSTTLDGDASLRHRPMLRVVNPLRQMGARIEGNEDGKYAPLTISGGSLTAIRYDSPLSSAQVKSAVLLAGLQSGVAVREPRRSRDHTERMLRAMGADLRETDDGWLELAGNTKLRALDIHVPRDLSAAAFWLVAASITEGSDLVLPGVGVNPTRAGIIDALRAMGADLVTDHKRLEGAEPVADLLVRATQLHGTRIDGELAVRCLDELPVLAVAAAFAEGQTVIADAEELRVKESDRIARVVVGLRALGVEVEERPDGMVIEGRGGRPPTVAATVDATGDHRIAMAFSVAALAGAGPLTITGAESVRSSYPAFRTHMEAVCPS